MSISTHSVLYSYDTTDCSRSFGNVFGNVSERKNNNNHYRKRFPRIGKKKTTQKNKIFMIR